MFQVIPGNDGKSLIPESEFLKPPEGEDLIYVEESPDYCVRDRLSGSLGTVGRECNTTWSGTGGCALLCCGRGHRTNVRYVQENCKCRFHWCCEVHCETCVVRKLISTCR